MSRPGVSAKGAARRDGIIETAYQVLAKGGYAQSSLRAIAKAAGVEPAHVLYYFSTREELLCEVITRWDEKNSPPQPGEDALDMLLATIPRNRKEPGIVHLYLTLASEAVDPSHPAHEYFERRLDYGRSLLADAIRFRQEAGRIRPGVDPETTARVLMAVADGMQLQSLINPDVDAHSALSATIRAVSTDG